MSTPTLVVVLPGHLPWDGSDRVKLPVKTSAGLAEYQKNWPGKMVVATLATLEGEDVDLGGDWSVVTDLPFELDLSEDLHRSQSIQNADIVLAPHTRDYGWLLDQSARVVYVTENLSSEWMKNELSKTKGLLNRARVRAGWHLHERQRQALARRAAGIQCNGFPVWEAYRKRAQNAILYFDTRLSTSHVEASRSAVEAKKEITDRPIRLAFSGRYLGIKGPEYVLQMQAKLEEAGISHELHMLGAGPMEGQLRAEAGSAVLFHKPRDFASEWVPWVRENVDLMVLPHVLGDPSGTYLEAAGLGVPILGFENVALESLVRNFNLGWTVPYGSAAGLAAKVKHLAKDRAELLRASEAGIRAMTEHHMEAEFQLRIDQLVKIVATN